MSEVKPHIQEQLLIEHVADLRGNVLCTSLGKAQLAAAIARNPDTQIACHYLDLYRAERAREHLQNRPGNLSITCTPDFPDEAVDMVIMPLSATGEAELALDFMQQGNQRLCIGGKMVLSTNNPHDRWVHQHLKRLFEKVERKSFPEGVIYSAIKTKALEKIKNFDSEFAFRDHGKLLRAYSRPGVFSHRKVDVGARKILEAMHIQSGYRVLDIGCGWGTLAVAAATRAENVEVVAIDSNVRAIHATQKSAELNDLTNVVARLTATGEHDHPGTYDLVLANPPYYANFRIAELFAITGQRALKPGGHILFVTKLPHWYEENLSRWFSRVTIEEAKGYFIIAGYKA